MTFELAIPEPDDPRWTRRGGVLIRRDEGVTKWVQGDTTTVKLTAAQSSGALGVLQTVVNPEAEPFPMRMAERRRRSTSFPAISISSTAIRSCVLVRATCCSYRGAPGMDSPTSARYPPPC